MRAVSTRIWEETAAGRLILPNDHVDVILTQRVRGRDSQDDYASDTLFRNVRVLAIGQQIETKKNNKSPEGSANTATLELTPEQAEMLARANSLGESACLCAASRTPIPVVRVVGTATISAAVRYASSSTASPRAPT